MAKEIDLQSLRNAIDSIATHMVILAKQGYYQACKFSSYSTHGIILLYGSEEDVGFDNFENTLLLARKAFDKLLESGYSKPCAIYLLGCSGEGAILDPAVFDVKFDI